MGAGLDEPGKRTHLNTIDVKLSEASENERAATFISRYRAPHSAPRGACHYVTLAGVIAREIIGQTYATINFSPFLIHVLRIIGSTLPCHSYRSGIREQRVKCFDFRDFVTFYRFPRPRLRAFLLPAVLARPVIFDSVVLIARSTIWHSDYC